MPVTNSLSQTLGIFDALVVAIMGYAVVFFGLVLLMAVVIYMGKYFIALEQKAKEGK